MKKYSSLIIFACTMLFTIHLVLAIFMDMINIFDYLDYREFLRDYYTETKKNKPFFSYRYIGNHVGMDSSYLIKVLQGSLHISSKKISSFVKLLNLDTHEAEFFETLVHFGRAKNEHETKIYFERLFTLSSVKAMKLEPFQFEFFQKWYYSAIWAIINCRPFDGNYNVLAETCMPAITVTDAKSAVRLLDKLGLISKMGDGCYHTTGQNVTTGFKWYSKTIENNQHEMIKLADESIDRFNKNLRDISTVTMCINKDALPEIRELITQFRSSLIKTVNGYDGKGRVYQLNVQLFPLSDDLEKNS